MGWRSFETVVNAAGIERFPLFGVSQGCAISIAYAVRHPERLSHLILSGGFALGRGKPSPREHEQTKAPDIMLPVDLTYRRHGQRPEAYHGSPTRKRDAVEIAHNRTYGAAWPFRASNPSSIARARKPAVMPGHEHQIVRGHLGRPSPRGEDERRKRPERAKEAAREGFDTVVDIMQRVALACGAMLGASSRARATAATDSEWWAMI
jgi:pimeloyl-ACP methyl ester carboxylesterase